MGDAIEKGSSGVTLPVSDMLSADGSWFAHEGPRATPCSARACAWPGT